MSKTVVTRSESGFQSTSAIRAFSLEIDPTGDDAPDTLESLLATYAACYIPALRVTASRADLEPLGAIEISVEGALNEDDKLEAVSFEITTDASLDDEAAETVITGANELCKVHDALRAGLHAETTLDGHTVG